jgi:hypothetical protein
VGINNVNKPEEATMINPEQSINQVRELINRANLTPDLTEKLQIFVEEMKAMNIKFNDVQSSYKKLVHDYFKATKPFEYNRNRTSMPVTNPAEDPNFDKDVDMYLQLIEYSGLSDDTEYSILQRWGIDYPFAPGGPGLSQPVIEYKKFLISVRDELSESMKPLEHYYTYIIEKLPVQ